MKSWRRRTRMSSILSFCTHRVSGPALQARHSSVLSASVPVRLRGGVGFGGGKRIGDVGGDRSGICSSNNKRRSKLTLYCDIRSLEELTDFRMGSDGSKPDFKELSKQSKYSTKELNDWYKKFKKDFPSGKINRPQFIELYKKMYGGGGGGAAAGGGGSGAGAVGADVNDFCDQIFRKYDADGDGTISFQEFMTTLSVASRGTPTEKLRWAFSMYDTDGNGYLTQKEITEILTAFYKSRGKENPSLRAIETAKEILKSADDDGDGRLSEAEFIRHSSNCDAIKEMLEGF